MSLTYYLVRNDSHYWTIGEISFKKFYTEYGWNALTTYINKNQTDILDKLTVRRSDGKVLTIEQFLEEIKSYQIEENSNAES